MVDLARYGMAAKAGALRKLATLLATVVYLEANRSMTAWTCWSC
jgi:hypothetical protein